MKRSFTQKTEPNLHICLATSSSSPTEKKNSNFLLHCNPPRADISVTNRTSVLFLNGASFPWIASPSPSASFSS